MRREPQAWAAIDNLVATKLPQRYDEAAKLLRDLRDLAIRRGDVAAVEARIDLLCAEHARKTSFIQRVRSAMREPELDDVS